MTTEQPFSACCLSGHLHTGTPVGSEEKIADLNVYVTRPADGSKAKTILFLTDIFGWQLSNSRLLADEYAKAGFYVYVPDFFQNDSVDHDLLDHITPRDPDAKTDEEKAANGAKVMAKMGPWMQAHPQTVAKPLIDKFVAAIRADPGTGKIGAVGFCWGGRYALLLGASPPTIDAIVSNHPSMLSIPADVENLSVPSQINVGTKDPFLTNEAIAQLKEYLASKPELISQVNVYEGAVHGFAVRGDLETPSEKEYKDKSATETILWFQKYLA